VLGEKGVQVSLNVEKHSAGCFRDPVITGKYRGKEARVCLQKKENIGKKETSYIGGYQRRWRGERPAIYVSHKPGGGE